MTRGVELSVTSAEWTKDNRTGMRLRIDVVRAEGMPSKIFAYREEASGPNGTVGVFSHVCNPTNLEEYPEDAPTDPNVPQWYRLDYVDIVYDSPKEAQEAEQIIREHVQALVDELNAADQLADAGTYQVGTLSTPGGGSGSGGANPDSVTDVYGTPATVSSYGTLSYELAGPGASWTKIGNGAGSPTLTADNNSSQYEEIALPPGADSRVLLVKGFDFDSQIPASARIDGVQVELVLRNPNAIGDDPANTETQLTYLALVSPTDGPSPSYIANQGIPGPNWYVATYGASNDLWGLSLTAADVRSGDFGVLLSVQADADAPADQTVQVDGIKLFVTYSPHIGVQIAVDAGAAASTETP